MPALAEDLIALGRPEPCGVDDQAEGARLGARPLTVGLASTLALCDGSASVSVPEEGPPDPTMSRPTIVNRPHIGAIKIPFPINPARDRPPATLIAAPVLLAHDFDVHHVV